MPGSLNGSCGWLPAFQTIPNESVGAATPQIVVIKRPGFEITKVAANGGGLCHRVIGGFCVRNSAVVGRTHETHN